MRRMGSIMMLGILSACQSTPPPVVEAPAPVVAEVVPPLSVPAEIVPPKPRFVIENIMGLARGTLRNILGEATLIRKEKDAEVWLYRNDSCVLHLYFYPNEHDDYRLDYVNTKGIGLSLDNPTVSPNACLDSHLLDEPEDAPAE